MFTQLYSLLSILAYISVSLAYYLYHHFFHFKAQKLENLHADSLQHVLQKLPFAHRLQAVQNVSSQWAEIVKAMCTTQKMLTLQIGSGNKWEKNSDIINRHNLLINVVSPFHTLTIARLTDELANFLKRTFPRLQTLAVVVDDQTEDADFFHCLPKLISSYSHTLTTLQLVWNVKEIPFQAVFNPLIVSIDNLHQLKRLSFFDWSNSLKVPPFDLPHLLSTCLTTLDFYSYRSSVDLARHWVGSLQARAHCSNNSNKPSLMKIYYYTSDLTTTSTPSFLDFFPASVAAHLHSVLVNPESAASSLGHLTSGTFSNLKNLTLQMDDTLSVGGVLVQLASGLPQLTRLYLLSDNLSKTEYPANRPLPVLPALQQLFLAHLHLGRPFHNLNTETLRPLEVFPNVQEIILLLSAARCTSCGWRMKVTDNYLGRSAVEVAEGSEHLVKQCLTQQTTHFATDKLRPKIIFSFKTRINRKINFIIHFEKNGKVQKFTRYICGR